MPLALSSARCLLSLAGGLALAAAACFAGWRLLAGDTTDIGNAVRRKSIGVTTNLLQSMAPDCTAALTCIPLCPQSLKNLHTLDTAAIWYGAGHMARCMQQSRVCAGKDRDCGQNSIPVRSQSAAQSGAFYICALRLLTRCLASGGLLAGIGDRAEHWLPACSLPSGSDN